jgi:ubiquinone/menaquinone biosynthesis C-methylase UbiE
MQTMALESYYDNSIAAYYDASPVVNSRADVAFYVNRVKEFGEPALELGCGSGRVTLAVADAGFLITGVDLSPQMLARAEEKLAEMPEETRARVNLVQGNMTNFDLGASFRLVIIPFRPFQHLLEVAQQLDCLERVRRHLQPGGRLVLDVFQTDARRMHDPEFLKEREVREYEMSGGRRVRLTERLTAFHRAEQKNDVEMVYHVTHPDGREQRLVMAFPFRYFFRYEVEHLLARSGFRVEETFGDFDRSPLEDHSPEMIFVARAT